MEQLSDIVKSMPKIELHAHLSGSLSTQSLLELKNYLNDKKCPGFNETSDDIKVDDKNDDIIEDLSAVFKKFDIVHNLTSTKIGLEMATNYIIRDFAADNVSYLELRTNPKQTVSMTKKEYLETVLNVIRSSKDLYPKITVKLLPSICRSEDVQSAKQTIEAVKDLLNLDNNYEDIIKGIDFSGNPYNENFSNYKEIFEKARKLNLKLALHCGEINNNTEIKEMINFGMDRCGHGTFINGHNFEMLKMKNIPIECCLSSNVKCKTVKSYSDHHFGKLFKMNYPVVICTDDSGIFNTSLSNEYKIACKYYNLTVTDLQMLSLTAIDVSFAKQHEKIQLKNLIINFFEDYE